MPESPPRRRIPWRWGIILLALAATILIAILAQGVKPSFAVMWLFGLAFGFILQRSRFCFASAFRDLFLLKEGRVMKAILGGMMVATVGFALVMYSLLPNLSPGKFPTYAGVTPLGGQVLFAGIIFGIGMVLAGGCISGTLYRIGEGYVASMVALVGMLFGFTLLGYSWNWLWQSYISGLPRVWLPHYFGWGGGVLLTLVGFALAYLLVLWWESRGGVSITLQTAEKPTLNFRQKISNLRENILVKAWPIGLAGILLGTMNTFEYLFERPWGVTGEMYRWADWLSHQIRLGPPALLGLEEAGGSCSLDAGGGGLLSSGFMVNVGMIFGAFIAALMAREFKFRLPKQKRRYAQSFAGGTLAGYGAGLALGCTLGAFFTAIPSLGLNGWVFGIGLAGGAFLGVKIIKRL